jgi:hypothetical protein
MFRPMIWVIIRHLLWSTRITQIINVNCSNVDPYCATGVCCCGWILICKVAVKLHHNVIMKLITSSYNSEFNLRHISTSVLVFTRTYPVSIVVSTVVTIRHGNWGLFQVLLRNPPKRLSKTIKSCRGSWCPGRYSNWTSPEYNSDNFLLEPASL